MELSGSGWVNMAKSAGDVLSQAVVHPGIMVAHAISDQQPQTQRKIAKNGQVFKQAVKTMITSAALFTKSLWEGDCSSTQRLLAEGEAPWPLHTIAPSLRIFHPGKRGELRVSHEESPDSFVQTLLDFGLEEDCEQIVWVTHGFMTTGEFGWLSQMKDEMLRGVGGGRRWVVIVDWGGGAFIGPHAYDSAAQNIHTVATWLSLYLSPIKQLFPSIYLWGVGHSLGAHLLGVAGKTSLAFDRITALDPAGPGFENYGEYGLDARHFDLRLSRGSAGFVDVIHTDGYSDSLHTQAIISPTNHYGTLIPLGHIDFYPNWGHSQPGTASSFNIIASHLRSIDLFISSIQHPLTTIEILGEIPGYMDPAKTKVKGQVEATMGFHCTSDGPRGNFYISTSDTPPYSTTSEQIESHIDLELIPPPQ